MSTQVRRRRAFRPGGERNGKFTILVPNSLLEIDGFAATRARLRLHVRPARSIRPGPRFALTSCLKLHGRLVFTHLRAFLGCLGIVNCLTVLE